MAQMFGNPGKEKGDQEVYKVLKGLPERYIIYAQPTIRGDKFDRYPDYVLIDPQKGVIIFEVKDWVTINAIETKQVKITRKKNQKTAWETNPCEQARQACYDLMNSLEKDRELTHKKGYLKGKLLFPVEYAAFLPNLPASTVTQFEEISDRGRFFGNADLNPSVLQEKLSDFPYHFHLQGPLSKRCINLIRADIDPRIVIKDSDGYRKGIFDLDQERLAKEPIQGKVVRETASSLQQGSLFQGDESADPDARWQLLESSMPEDASELKTTPHIRLVRGYAGTGKTDVLLLRAKYLYDQYPDKDILITTFNRPVFEKRLLPEVEGLRDRIDVRTFDSLCRTLYQTRHDGDWKEPQNTQGVISKLLKDDHEISTLIKTYGKDFLIDEIIWMKETGFTTPERYVHNYREGRGKISGRRLSENQKREVFQIFAAYQNELRDIPAFDWVDLHEKALKYLEDGIKPEKKYDVILIDEGQHFAPTWIGVIKHLLIPGGNLYICEDPSQSVYRVFSWRDRGVDVVGRTRWLRIPYRNTKQIFQAAYHLAQSNPVAMQMIAESGERVEPNFDAEELREGDFPLIKEFDSVAAEKAFIREKIQTLLEEGFMAKEIALFHDKDYVRKKYQRHLPRGITVDEPRRQTGMEYRAVFIPQIQNLFERDTNLSWKKAQAKQQYLFYTAMTRARDKLYMTYQQKWPKYLQSFSEYAHVEKK